MDFYPTVFIKFINLPFIFVPTQNGRVRELLAKLDKTDVEN